MNKWLAPHLKANNMTQKQLAERIGVHPVSLSRKCSGVLQFTYSEVVMICKILHIPNPLDVFPDNTTN